MQSKVDSYVAQNNIFVYLQPFQMYFLAPNNLDPTPTNSKINLQNSAKILA